MNSKKNVKSPCISICYIDPKTELCTGCFRSLEEISFWSSYTYEQKINVINKIKERVSSIEENDASKIKNENM